MNEYKYRLKAQLFYSTTVSHTITITREWDYLSFITIQPFKSSIDIQSLNRARKTEGIIETCTSLDYQIDDYIKIGDYKYRITDVEILENGRQLSIIKEKIYRITLRK